MYSYSSGYDTSMLGAGIGLGAMILIYAVILLFSLIVYFVMAFPYYKMAKRQGLPHAWVAFIPMANLYIAAVLPQFEFNLFNKFIWPKRSKAFWVYLISFVIYCVLATPMIFVAMIPILGWLLFMAYILIFMVFWYIIMWKINYDLLIAYGMEQHAMWASIVNIFCPLVMVVFSFIIMNKDQVNTY